MIERPTSDIGPGLIRAHQDPGRRGPVLHCRGRRLQTGHSRAGERSTSPSATVVAIKVREQAFDYLVLADSVLSLDLWTGLRVVTDDHEAQIGRQFRAQMDAWPNGTPEHEKAHRQYVERDRKSVV